jgi:hypothetical protein
MKAVLRLILIYFTGTPLLRGVTALGLLCAAAGAGAWLYLPPLRGQLGAPSWSSGIAAAAFILLPIAGILCLLFGALLMPTLFARLAASHYAYVLPYGRIKLLASAFGTVTLLALVASAIIIVYYIGTPMPLDVVFLRALAVTLLTYTLLYVVLWFVGRSRTAIGLLGGAMLVIVTLLLPMRFIAMPTTSLWWPLGGCALLWSLLAAGFVAGSRLKGTLGKARVTLLRVANSGASPEYHGGRELDFLVGTARPWLLALGQLVPIAIMTYLYYLMTESFIEAPSVWLFYLTIFSALSGAITSLAATRSRALWLRAHWTRGELFARVEAAFWRHNSYTLGVLLIVLVAIGTYLGLSTQLLGFGLPLLLLGSAVSTYLGLMMTRGIGWLESVLAVGTMLLLMSTAVYAADPIAAVVTVIALEALLGALALLFRSLAQRRWNNLDWMLCRPELGVRASA